MDLASLVAPDPEERQTRADPWSTGRMAAGATVHNFDIDLADADRQVYETLALRLARHPSESAEYLLTRVLAYALEFESGIAFSTGGLSDPDEPALSVRDLTGAIRSWIEIGSPDAARLHKAAKSGARVVVYTHKNPDQFLKQLAGEKIYRPDELELYAMDRGLVAGNELPIAPDELALGHAD